MSPNLSNGACDMFGRTDLSEVVNCNPPLLGRHMYCHIRCEPRWFAAAYGTPVCRRPHRFCHCIVSTRARQGLRPCRFKHAESRRQADRQGPMSDHAVPRKAGRRPSNERLCWHGRDTTDAAQPPHGDPAELARFGRRRCLNLMSGVRDFQLRFERTPTARPACCSFEACVSSNSITSETASSRVVANSTYSTS